VKCSVVVWMVLVAPPPSGELSPVLAASSVSCQAIVRETFTPPLLGSGFVEL
jgi:hypothetical protein